MRAEQRKAFLFELADTLLQSWWTLVAGVCFGLTGAVIALSFTQSWYQAKALIYVTPELSRELARTTVSEDMTRRMLALQEGVLSPEVKRRVVEILYGESKSEEQLQRRIRSVERRVIIEPASLGTAAGPDALFAFSLTFTDTEPERTARGANALAELYIEQNTEFRAKQARDVARAAEEQAAAAREEFEDLDQELIRFREQHRFETVDHQDANLRLLERRQNDLDNNLTDQRAAENHLSDLESRLVTVKAGSAATAEEVATLRRQLDELLTQYSEAHPEVIRVRRKLGESLAKMGLTDDAVQPSQTPASDYPPDPQVKELQDQIARVRRELTDHRSRERRVRDEIAEYERRVDAVPQVQPLLSRLLNEHQMLRDRYELLQEKADKAGQALFLEEKLRGERFELAERADVPKTAVFPQPIRFYALGVIVGCMLFVGPLLARRFLNPRISSESGLRSLTEVPVLVTLPRIVTASTRGYAIRRLVKNLALSIICAAVTVGAFTFFG